MIPKIIHYCWLSDEPYPAVIERCIASWKEKLPDYEIKKWDTKAFDINSVPYVKEAFEERKWAFAADYIRLHAIYTEGGIYLDSDVLVQKNFDQFLDNPCFSAIEFNKTDYIETLCDGVIDRDGNLLKKTDIVHGCGIQAAVIASEKGNPFIADCLSHYTNRHFRLSDGTLDNKIIAPDVLASIAVKYGFKYKDVEQRLSDGTLILPSSYIGGHAGATNPNYVAIHCCAASWRKLSLMDRIKRKIRYMLYVK